MKAPLSATEAQNCIFEHISVSRSELVPLENSLGRVLAEDIIANRNHPPYDVSAMDGYALRYEDIASAKPHFPVKLDIVEEIRAGHPPQVKVLPKQSSRIMTGAAIPEGVDTVVRVEDTQETGNCVFILNAPEQGANIRPLGENLERGKVVLTKKTRVTPGVYALLAMLKQKTVSVIAHPTVAILSTGDELEGIDEEINEEKIPDSNSHALYSQCKSLGIEATLLGIAPDDVKGLEEKLVEGIKYEVLLVSGGVSVGEYDWVRPTLDKLGITMHFWRIAIRPGHPLAFGSSAKTSVFALPGNPVSSMVCFEEFVAPALRHMSGYTRCHRRTLKARIAHDFTKKAGRTHFVRVFISRENDEYVVTSTGTQGSGVLLSMAKADGFMIVPSDSTGFKAGDWVSVQILEGMNVQEESDLGDSE